MLSSAAGDLLLAGTASTTRRTVFPPPPFSWSLGENTKKRGSGTKIEQANFDQRAPLFYRKVTKTKLRQNLVFDPGGFPGCLSGCLFQGGRRAFASWGCSFGALTEAVFRAPAVFR